MCFDKDFIIVITQKPLHLPIYTTYLLYCGVAIVSSTINIHTGQKNISKHGDYCCLNFVFPVYFCVGCMLCSRSSVGCFPVVLCSWILHRR